MPKCSKRPRLNGLEGCTPVARPDAWGGELAEDPIQLSQAILPEPRCVKAPRRASKATPHAATPWRNMGRRQRRERAAATSLIPEAPSIPDYKAGGIKDVPLIFKCLRQNAVALERPSACVKDAGVWPAREAPQVAAATTPPKPRAEEKPTASSRFAELLRRPTLRAVAIEPGACKPPPRPIRAAGPADAGAASSPSAEEQPLATLGQLRNLVSGTRVVVQATASQVGEIQREELAGQPGVSVATRAVTLRQGNTRCQWILWAGAAERYGQQLQGKRIVVRGAQVQEIMGARQLKGCSRVDIHETEPIGV